MKRLFLFLLIVALAVVAVVYAVRVSRKTSTVALAALLPRDTIGFAHLPDFNAARKAWFRSDIYQLYAEPAVQEFLRRKPTEAQPGSSLSQTGRQFEQINPRDVFVALISVQEKTPALLGGFRFSGSQNAAESVVGQWRSQLLGPNPTKRETVDYQQHKIDIYGAGFADLAMVYDGHWFLASNDRAQLQAALDRLDGRVKDAQALLSADETFRAAMAKMPADYALNIYVQPKMLSNWLAPEQRARLEQIRSICATTRFDNGKMHDVVFMTVPKLAQPATLARDSATLGTKDTFLYLAGLFGFSDQLTFVDPSSMGVLGGAVRKIQDALTRANITMEQWNAAFGSEVGVLADWAPSAHWPSAVAAFQVKDFARAKQLAGVIARASDEDASWRETDRNGVHYISMQSASGFLVLKPTIAISTSMMVVGPDPGSVQAAVERSGSSTAEFSRSHSYKNAIDSVSAPTNLFAYVDLGLLYSRLDATLRPLLMMGAAFVPALAEQVDLGRLPAAEIVTKHLSPIVSSQSYQRDGYLVESVGPITLSHSGIALMALVAVSSRSDGLGNALGGLTSPSLLKSAPSTAAPTP